MSNKRAKRANRPNPRNDRNQNVIEIEKFKRKPIALIPRNVNQEDYIDAINDEQNSIIVATGPAGCGKTWLATLAAVKALNDGECDKIVITRPNRAVDDNDIGYLPGDIFNKMLPWMMPILDILKEHYSPKEVENMILNEVIEICPIAFIRGRTFKNSFILVDEAQGTTKTSMLSILTRIGENSKMIVTGDLKQSDIGATNGLQDFLNRYTESASIEVIHFGIGDVERSRVVTEVLKLYGE